LAQGFPTAFVCEFQKTQHVIYRGFDDHIYELAGVDQWNHTDLTVAAGGAPLAATDPDAYVLSFQGTQHVNYWGHDGHLHELWWGLDQWHHADLTLTSTGHDVQHSIGAAVGFVFEPLETQFLYYSGIDGNIYELRWHVGGPWTATDVTTVPGVAAPPSISNPSGYVFPPYGSFPNVVYNSDQHHIVRLSFTP
jgi:hypothetical protein